MSFQLISTLFSISFYQVQNDGRLIKIKSHDFSHRVTTVHFSRSRVFIPPGTSMKPKKYDASRRMYYDS